MIHLPPGQSRYTSDCDVSIDDDVLCGVCGGICEVNRKANGYQSYAAAMTSHEDCYDEFMCPHRNKRWHANAENLLRLSKNTPSPTLAEIYRQDAENFVTKKTP